MWMKLGVSLLLLLAASALALAWFGPRIWARETELLRRALAAARVAPEQTSVDFGELHSLPEPVQRYFRKVLKHGQPVILGARLRHDGGFNISETGEAWKPFTSQQVVVTRRPGFDWDARITMFPGVAVHVHDAYVAGEGILHAALFGLFTVADLRGTADIAAGELMRFLAEAAWYPTALLPSQGVRWQGVNDHSAQATLRDGTAQVTLLFTFNDLDLITSVKAEARGRLVGKQVVATPWQAVVSDYQQQNGMLVPMQGEVSWVTAEGLRPYWRGHVREIVYSFPRMTIEGPVVR
jgi:hypothetical protein